MIITYFKLLRIHHWIKNLLIFIPFIFNNNFSNSAHLYALLWGFLSFSLMASAIYIVNDIGDRAIDREHPTKCHRPLASGKIKLPYAVVLLIILVALALFLSYPNRESILILIIYLLLNIAYSYGLKHLPLCDISILASGYLLRVLFGAGILNITVSVWLYLVILMISFFMGFGKRRGEYSQPETSKRNVMQFYTYEFLDKNMTICMTLILTFYALWSIDPKTIAHLHTTNLLYTVPLVYLICLRYSFVTEGNVEGDPIPTLLKDKVLLGLLFLYGVSLLFMLNIFSIG